MKRIKNIRAREILDSRGNPTIEVDLKTSQGIFISSVPSGASTGKYEAVELRDGGKRYNGKGVLKAVANVNKIIAPKIKGKDCAKQKKIDDLMIEIDGTKNKERLGSNAILAVSMATCRAGAAANNLSLWKYVALISETKKPKLPTPFVLMFEGGLHAGNDLDIQEFMIAPVESSYEKKLETGATIYHNLEKILEKKYGSGATNVGFEGGFAAPLKNNEEALSLIVEVAKKLGYENKIKIALDIAATSFYKNKEYIFEGKKISAEKFLNFYKKFIKKYPVFSIEDPYFEEDWKNWTTIQKELKKSKTLIVGDDLLATNPLRIQKAESEKACNSTIIKVNQIGTVFEAIKATNLAKSFGWKIIVSHRGGETCDDFIADFATGVAADYIKAGGPTRGERIAKHNRLTKIEKEIS